MINAASLAYAEGYPREDALLAEARQRASVVGVAPIGAGGGATIAFLDGDKVEYAEYLDEAVRLVRPGGLICFDNALWHDRVADPAQRDPETSAIRDLLQRVSDDEGLRAVVLPVGDGLLAVQKIA